MSKSTISTFQRRANSAPTQATLDRIDSLEALKKTADVVLAYRPKSKQPKPRKRKL